MVQLYDPLPLLVRHHRKKAKAILKKIRSLYISMSCVNNKQVIEKFQKGEYNVIVATCIGEEGLDIGEVDMIICFDSQASPIRMLQRIGRTGRKREGKIVVLLTKGKEEEAYKKAQSSYKSVQNGILDPKKLVLLPVVNMIPNGIKKPEAMKMLLDIQPDELKKHKSKSMEKEKKVKPPPKKRKKKGEVDEPPLKDEMEEALPFFTPGKRVTLNELSESELELNSDDLLTATVFTKPKPLVNQVLITKPKPLVNRVLSANMFHGRGQGATTVHKLDDNFSQLTVPKKLQVETFSHHQYVVPRNVVKLATAPEIHHITSSPIMEYIEQIPEINTPIDIECTDNGHLIDDDMDFNALFGDLPEDFFEDGPYTQKYTSDIIVDTAVEVPLQNDYASEILVGESIKWPSPDGVLIYTKYQCEDDLDLFHKAWVRLS